MLIRETGLKTTDCRLEGESLQHVLPNWTETDTRKHWAGSFSWANEWSRTPPDFFLRWQHPPQEMVMLWWRFQRVCGKGIGFIFMVRLQSCEGLLSISGCRCWWPLVTSLLV